MTNFRGVTLLDLVEAYAENNGIRFDSEDAVSAAFDEEIAPIVISQYGEHDQPAIDQAFNDWTDSLCKEDELHPEQYDQYTYVGKYAQE